MLLFVLYAFQLTVVANGLSAVYKQHLIHRVAGAYHWYHPRIPEIYQLIASKVSTKLDSRIELPI